MIGNPRPVAGRERLAWEIRTLADRFRGLSAERLSRPFPPYESRADAGRRLAQQLADAAAGVAGRDASEAPPTPRVPTIGVFAVGEQIAVTGRDLITELADVSSHAIVWHDGERITAAELIATITETLKQLRLTL